MKVITRDTLYYEDHGATLKHKCGKRDSNIAPFIYLFFSLAFFSFGLFGGGNALIMMIITLLLITTYELQLETRTRYDSI